MPAGKYDLTIDQGSDFEISIAIEEDGSPMDGTNYYARASLRSKIESATSTNFTASITTGGVVTISLTNSETAAMTAGSYVYDVEIFQGTAPNETLVTRILQGKASVTPEVTR